jgi:topoisomerase-4 subunit B
MNEYAKKESLLKIKDSNLEGDDLREGLTAIISIKIPENILEFVGQTKDSLSSKEAKQAIEEILDSQLIF